MKMLAEAQNYDRWLEKVQEEQAAITAIGPSWDRHLRLTMLCSPHPEVNADRAQFGCMEWLSERNLIRGENHIEQRQQKMLVCDHHDRLFLPALQPLEELLTPLTTKIGVFV